MRIQSVTIKNLRCIKDSTINLDPYTCLVGPNGAGKSTLLCALNIFFRQIEDAPTDVTALSINDFHLQDTSDPIKITVTVTDVNDQAKEDLKQYVRQDKLIVTAVAKFETHSGRAEVKQYGERLGMVAFKSFFEAHGKGELVSKLKEHFEALEKSIPDLATKKSKKTKDGMYDTLRTFEAEKPDLCEPIPSEDQFYGFSRGTDRLRKYIQWIFVPAVKDASEEQSESKTSALGKILARTVRAKVNFSPAVETMIEQARSQYQKMLDENKPALEEVSKTLSSRLAEWAHPGASLRITWQQDSSKAVRVDQPLAGVLACEDGFEGELVRFGHGFQRSYLLALLHELAYSDDKSAPTLILGCEEPELYQHPPQARHLVSVFEKLAQSNTQIVVTTHSPYFVTGKNFESVRMVRRELPDRSAMIRQFSYAETAARFAEVVGEQPKDQSAALSKVNQALQPTLNEMFFTERLVLVEGLEDVAYIHSWLVLTERWEDYRKSGCHIVPVNGKSEMIRPAIIAKGLKIPVMVVMDADGDKIQNGENRTRHHRDNLALVRLFNGDTNDIFPIAPVWKDNFVMWPSNLADTVEREFVASLNIQGQEQFESMQNIARRECGDAGDLGKNSIYIGHLLTLLKEKNVTSASLDKLCDAIIKFGADSSKLI